ncbi:MAG: hypothetical protein ACYCPP_07950 [Nitrososphaerales archaeon]
MGIITLKIDDDIEDKLRRKVGRDRGAARGAISSSVEEAIRAWLQENKTSENQTQTIVHRSYIAKKGENEETVAEANTLESLSVKIRELGINPRSVIIESVPPSPLTRKMGLRITGRNSETKS